jgi:triphosphoribosyl-dephospho-CoA synthase
VRASLAAAGCNTNLGIVLLCAPVAAACERWRPADGAAGLRAALRAVLEGLDVEDARAAYRAIALARPGGLGTVARHDVAEPARIGLREAMALAAPRPHRLAVRARPCRPGRTGLPAFEACRRPGRAIQRVPEFLARAGFTHCSKARRGRVAT